MKEEDTKELIAVMSDSSAKEAAAILHNAGYNRYNGLVDQVKDAIRDNKKWESRTLAANRALGTPAWGDQVKAIENLIAENASLKTHIEKMDAAHREEIEKLEADLAESPRIEIALREAHIDALETQNTKLQKRIDEGDFGAICAVRRALRDAGVSDSLGPADGIQSLVDIIEEERAHAAESEREAAGFREELRTTLRDLHTVTIERDDWKSTAQSLAKTLQGMNEKYFDLLESVPQAGVRSSIRRRLNRFLMEVVR